MVHLLSSLPYPLTILIFSVGIIVTIYVVVKYHNYFKILGSCGFIFICGLSSAFGAVYKTIRVFHVFENMKDFTANLMGVSILIGIVLLAIKTYIEVFSKNPKYKKTFWIYTICLSLIILFIVIGIALTK